MSENYNIEDFINVKSPVKEEEVRFKRIPAPFKIRSLTAKEMADLRKESTETSFNKKTNTIDKTLNQNTFEGKLMAASVVVPNLSNEKLQKHYGAYGDPAGTLEAMLLAGEYNILAEKVMELSGVDQDSESNLIKQAKN